MRVVYIAVGGNEGERFQNLVRGINLIGLRYPVEAVSSVYLTEAWGFEGRDFLNAVLLVRSSENPFAMLHYLKHVERRLGRKTLPRKGYSPRPFDADILLYEGLRVRSPELTVPHPKMHLRDFVNVPLKELFEAGYPTLGYSPNTRGDMRIVRVIEREALFKMVGRG